MHGEVNCYIVDSCIFHYCFGAVEDAKAVGVSIGEYNPSSETKYVKYSIRYDKDLTGYVISIWYDDGTYRGYLRSTELYQNRDDSWLVYYEGTVRKGPYAPNCVIIYTEETIWKQKNTSF